MLATNKSVMLDRPRLTLRSLKLIVASFLFALLLRKKSGQATDRRFDPWEIIMTKEKL